MDKVEHIGANIEKLKSLVKDLGEYETDRPYGNNDAADKAVVLTRDHFSSGNELFKSRKMVVTYHGSMQYHDPVHLDVDVIFFTEHKVDRGAFWYIHKMEEDMEQNVKWPVGGKPRGNFGFFSIDEIRREADNYTHGKVPDIQNDDAATFASFALTSKALFPEQEETLEKLRNDTLAILSGCPVLLELVIDNVQDCIKVCQERRLTKSTSSLDS